MLVSAKKQTNPSVEIHHDHHRYGVHPERKTPLKSEIILWKYCNRCPDTKAMFNLHKYITQSRGSNLPRLRSYWSTGRLAELKLYLRLRRLSPKVDSHSSCTWAISDPHDKWHNHCGANNMSHTEYMARTYSTQFGSPETMKLQIRRSQKPLLTDLYKSPFLFIVTKYRGLQGCLSLDRGPFSTCPIIFRIT